MFRTFQVAAVFCWLLTAIGCADQAPRQGSTTATPAQTQKPEYPVRLLFDGGYAFLRDDAKETLTIAAFHVKGEEGAMMTAHHLRVRLNVGTPVQAPKPSSPEPTWNLDDQPYDVSVASYGSTPAGVKLPNATPIDPKDPCKAINEGSAEANNLNLFPVLNELAVASKTEPAIDLNRNRYQNRVLLTSGTMSIEKTTSCFAFREGAKTIKNHRVPNGLAGTVVTFRLTENLKLNVTDQAGATSSIEIAPDVHGGTGVRQIEVWFGRFAPECKESEPGCIVKTGEVLTDFLRFYTLLVKPPRSQDQVKPYNLSPAGDVTPKSQCTGAIVKIG